ncbi:MAG: hypothetical protein IPP81_12945 [Chitinophagaceae bacterium]|nr:hypothetical protein [Chitinophagaceae bacterium]
MEYIEKVYSELQEINSDIVKLILMPYRGMGDIKYNTKITKLIERVYKLKLEEPKILEELDLLFFENKGKARQSSWLNILEIAFQNLCKQFSDEPLTPEFIFDTKQFFYAYSNINKKIHYEKAEFKITITDFSLFYAYTLFSIKNAVKTRKAVVDETIKFIILQSFPVLDGLEDSFANKILFPSKLNSRKPGNSNFDFKHSDHTEGEVEKIFFPMLADPNDQAAIKNLIKERDEIARKNNSIDQIKCFNDRYNNCVMIIVCNYIRVNIQNIYRHSDPKPSINQLWDLVRKFNSWFDEFLKWDFIKFYSPMYSNKPDFEESHNADGDLDTEKFLAYWQLDMRLAKLVPQGQLTEEFEDRKYGYIEMLEDEKKETYFESLVGQDYYSKSLEDFKENLDINKLNFGTAQYLKYLREEKLRYTKILEYCLLYNIWEEYLEIKSIVNFICNEIINLTKNKGSKKQKPNSFQISSTIFTIDCYNTLVNHGFISERNNSYRDFDKIFRNKEISTKIDWIGEQQELARFVYFLHVPSIENDHTAPCKKILSCYEVACKCFTLNRKEIKEEKLKSSNRKLNDQVRNGFLLKAIKNLR